MSMKMLMVICPEDRQAQIRELIEKHNVHAYTEVREVIGEGERGKKMGTRVWPGTSALIFTVVPDEKIGELSTALRKCATELYPGEGMRALVLPVEQMI